MRRKMFMKNKILNGLITGCAALLLCSCAKELPVSPEEMVYGPKDSISISVGYALVGVQSRSGGDETLIENINLYIVNELGDLVTYQYHTTVSPVQVIILKNMKYTVYAVANAGRELPATTAAEIESLIYDMEDVSGLNGNSEGMLMSGCSKQQLLTDGQSITIDLRRCISKVVVKADYSELNSDVLITVKSVQLKNVPKTVNLFSDSKISGPNGSLNGPLIQDPEVDDLRTGIIFYQYENKQGTLQPDNLDQKKKVWPDENIYSKICSYVEMQATYASSRKKGMVVYRFYLGTDMVANYDVIRNTQHTIVVNFKGDGALDENTWRVDNSDIVDLVTSITLNPVSHKFTTLGATVQLSATILPMTANNKILTWSSSDEQVAKVDASGLVTAIGDGSCTITATSTDGTNISANCSIEVDSKIYVTDVTVNPETIELFAGEQGVLTVTVTPPDATVPDVVWSSSDEQVAKVDASGNVTAVAVGSCTITATSKEDDSKKGSCQVTVKSKEFSITPTAKTLYVGERFSIGYTVKPPILPTFVSETPAVAMVNNNGQVTAVAAGTAKIKVSAHEMDLYCTVTVVNPQIAFPEPGRIMYDGETVTVPYSILVPATAAPEVTTSNSNATITEVTSTGITIRANTTGSCVITARVGPVSASYLVDIQPLRIVFNDAAPLIFYKGFDDPVNYTIYPEHARDLRVNLRSSDEENLAYQAGMTFRGGSGNTTANITATFVDFPTKTYSINCIIKPAIDIVETQLELVTDLDPMSEPLPNGVYTQQQLTIDTHPRAVPIFTSDFPDIRVSDTGVVTPMATGNGIYTDATMGTTQKRIPIKAKVTGDDGIPYLDVISQVTIYENAIIFGSYGEYTTGAVDPSDSQEIEYYSTYQEASTKGITNKEYPYRDEITYFWDNYSYPVTFCNFAVEILETYRRIIVKKDATDKGIYYFATTYNGLNTYK